MLAAVYAVLLYVATAVFLGGLAVRVWQYASTPNPLKIVATPAPTTGAGVCLRLGFLTEVHAEDGSAEEHDEDRHQDDNQFHRRPVLCEGPGNMGAAGSGSLFIGEYY